MNAIETQIIETTEVSSLGGIGDWMPLSDAPDPVREAVSSEVGECMFRDMRHEVGSSNTDDAGSVVVGGQVWAYRR